MNGGLYFCGQFGFPSRGLPVSRHVNHNRRDSLHITQITSQIQPRDGDLDADRHNPPFAAEDPRRGWGKLASRVPEISIGCAGRREATTGIGPAVARGLAREGLCAGREGFRVGLVKGGGENRHGASAELPQLNWQMVMPSDNKRNILISR